MLLSAFNVFSRLMSLQGTSLSTGDITYVTLVRLLPSVGVGMDLKTTSCSAGVVTAATFVRLLPSVGVGMDLQITSCSA